MELPVEVGDIVMVETGEGYGFGDAVAGIVSKEAVPADILVYVPGIARHVHTLVRVQGISYEFNRATGVGWGIPVGIPV